jgi:uncharacterized membrane-anchored protein YhcB (DUF1043 family)
MSTARGLHAGVAIALLALAVPVHADEAAERARISRERAEAQARFEQRQRECAQRFAVTPCVEEARAEHRQAMIQLRRQEGVLDEAQRKQRAAARLAAIEEKRRAEAERSVSPHSAAGPAASVQVKPPRAPASAARAASVPASSPSTAVREQRKRAQFEARQRDAQAHREASQRRRAERETAGKATAPLPDPAAR